MFTDAELAYLRERRLGRVATVGENGMPHVTPVGWRFDEETGTVEVGGIDFARTKKYRDVGRSRKAAIVIDDLASVKPWRPRGIEIRGDAEVLEDPPRIRIRPSRVVSWGIDGPSLGDRD